MKNGSAWRTIGALLILAAYTLANSQDAGVALIDTPEKAKAAQAAWAAKLGRPVQWTNSVGMKFQLIPPGEFGMGAKDGDADAPLHRVKLTEPFYLGTFEVTREEWEKVMKVRENQGQVFKIHKRSMFA